MSDEFKEMFLAVGLAMGSCSGMALIIVATFWGIVAVIKWSLN